MLVLVRIVHIRHPLREQVSIIHSRVLMLDGCGHLERPGMEGKARQGYTTMSGAGPTVFAVGIIVHFAFGVHALCTRTK